MVWKPEPWQKDIESGKDPFSPGSSAPSILFPPSQRSGNDPNTPKEYVGPAPGERGFGGKRQQEANNPNSPMYNAPFAAVFDPLEGLGRPAPSTPGLSAAQKAYVAQLKYGELQRAQAPLGPEFSGLATGQIAPGFGVHGLEEQHQKSKTKAKAKGGIAKMASALDILNPIHDLASIVTDVEEAMGWNAGDFTPQTHGGVGHRWTANGAEFQMNDDGTITVKRKDGTYKTYKPYRPMVFGKKLKVNAFIRLSRKYEKEWKDLDKIFKHKTLRRKKR